MNKITSIILILFLSLLSSPSWSETLSIEDLFYNIVSSKELYYKKSSRQLFTGEISGSWNGKFKEGKKEGLFTIYYENGMLHSKEYFKNGERNGSIEHYNSNGKLLRRGSFKNGVLHGFWEDFDGNGTLLNVGNYDNGKNDGFWKRFYRNGQLQEKGVYINDKKDGVWEHYYSDGTPMKNVTWKNGVKQE